MKKILFFLIINLIFNINLYSQFNIERVDTTGYTIETVDTINSLPVLKIFSTYYEKADRIIVHFLPKELPDCYFKFYDSKGKDIIYYGKIKNNLLDGNITLFYDEQHINIILNYKEGTPIGTGYGFYPDGKLKCIIYFDDSYKSEYWTPEGQKMSIELYRDIYGW